MASAFKNVLRSKMGGANPFGGQVVVMKVRPVGLWHWRGVGETGEGRRTSNRRGQGGRVEPRGRARERVSARTRETRRGNERGRRTRTRRRRDGWIGPGPEKRKNCDGTQNREKKKQTLVMARVVWSY